MGGSGGSVWPNDAIQDPREMERESPHEPICFLLSPFEPKDQYDQVQQAVERVCNECARAASVQIRCRRADTLYESKSIHDDIWRHINTADVLVIDITALNPNVMIELGVAAALRSSQQVILIRSAEEASRLPFNAFAQRYLSYSRSIAGDSVFMRKLLMAMIYAITPAPYSPPGFVAPPERFRVDLSGGDRPDLLIGPSITHRRTVHGLLEFGSFRVFRNSWLMLGTREYAHVKVRMSFRFGEVPDPPGEGFVGISLRNQHFLANWGHMICLNTRGHLWRTEPLSDEGQYRNVDVGDISGFDFTAPDLTDLTVGINEKLMFVDAAGLQRQFSLDAMPFVYAAGRIRVVTHHCRILIHEVEVEPL